MPALNRRATRPQPVPDLGALVEHSPDLFLVIDAAGTLRFVTEASARFVGCTAADLAGTNALDLVHADDRGWVAEALGNTVCAGTGPRPPIALRIIRADGSPRLVEIVANNRLADPDVNGIVVSGRDITDRADTTERRDLTRQRFEDSFEHAPSGRMHVSPDGQPAFLGADVADITELREAEAARQRAESRMQALVDNTAEVIVILEPDGGWRWSNPAFTHTLGYDLGQDPTPGGSVLDLIHSEDLANATEGIQRLLEGTVDPGRVRTVRVRAADGSWRWLAFHSRNLVDDPAVGGLVLFGHDVTDEHDARQRVAQLYEVFENSGEIVFLADRAGSITYANQTARQLFGIGEGTNLLADGNKFLTPPSQYRFTTEALPCLRRTGTWSGELTLFTTTGEVFALAIRMHLHRDHDGSVALVSGIAHDIRELIEAHSLLEHQATHDPLTGLLNRQLFQELGEQALARAERDGTTVAVLYLDLDHFKRVNDGHGHPAGDRVLQEIGERLRGCVRRGDAVARFGGDEFVVLCEHPAGEEDMAHLARRVIEAASLPVPVDGRTVRSGVSIGIALGAGPRVTIDALLRDADAALYQAKEEGRGRAVRFGAPPAEQ